MLFFPLVSEYHPRVARFRMPPSSLKKLSTTLADKNRKLFPKVLTEHAMSRSTLPSQSKHAQDWLVKQEQRSHKAKWKVFVCLEMKSNKKHAHKKTL
jgi:hypothetical protein